MRFTESSRNAPDAASSGGRILETLTAIEAHLRVQTAKLDALERVLGQPTEIVHGRSLKAMRDMNPLS
jgi:hypothetical protein